MKSEMKHWRAAILLLVVCAALALRALLQPAPVGSSVAAIEVGDALGSASSAGYARAYAPRSFVFPADHAAHPDFRNEWWYFTGNLRDPAGRAFGYQLTLFRIAIAPGAPAEDSAWRTHTVYMGHFAISDLGAARHLGFERYSRAALGLAGSTTTPLAIWLEDWRIEAGDGANPRWHLQAAAKDVTLQLTLEPVRAIVLQGDDGLSRKSAEPGNASYYYSVPRLTTQGTLTLDGQRFAVSGQSWLDREWSTSALGSGQSGWDWFALQFDDGRELMYYRLRRSDGGSDPLSAGTLSSAAGILRHLHSTDLTLEARGEWRSPYSGLRYPAGWHLAVPAAGIDVQVVPKLAEQEMRLSVHYWEGAVSVTDAQGRRLGEGYLEMTQDGPAVRTR